ncbi:hypothetical protein [Bacillus tropicus]|uniref:hypothetical protein n=1 Tax=Bacillus tropicus TaxID=2026188 RepID=UPI000B42E582|nr:hypothetical protein [Bacillus tropicus]MBG9937854.1 hypothetical protein [Bacillus tropicus]MED2996954.1 hypothetical protein [Bacillus tropicus]OTY54776.1 hypothetical protein BK748_17395 [Bacillus thuringiensis serovar graciosensis]
MNILKILSIDFKLKFTIQYSAILNRFSFTKRVSTRNLILCIMLFKIFIGIFMFYISNVLFNEKYMWNILYTNVGFLIISCFIKSIASYKETAMLKSDIYIYSLFSMEKIYNLNMLSFLLWALFGNISSLSLFLILSMYLKGFAYAILSLINCILLIIFIFTLFNKISTSYFISKIQKPIGAIRFLFYAIFSCLFFFLGYKLVDILKTPFYVVRERIITSKILTDEDYAEKVTQELFNSIINPLQESMNKIVFALKSICDYIIFSSYMSFILLICIALVLSIKSKPLLNRFIVSLKNKKDLLYYFSKLYSLFNRRIFNDDILEFEIKLLERERFLISPKFFQMIFFTYESLFYMGLFVNLFQSSHDNVLEYLLFMALLLLIMFNHCFELRTEYPQLFLLGAIKEKIVLFRFSGTGIYPLYRSKISLMYTLMIIPTICLLMVTIYMMFINTTYIFGIIIICITFRLVPIVQMWATTFLIKTDYITYMDVGSTEEEEFINKIQAIPRKILVLPLLYFLYFLLFMQIPVQVMFYIFFVYVIFYILISGAFIFVSKKYAVNNIKKFDSNWLRL